MQIHSVDRSERQSATEQKGIIASGEAATRGALMTGKGMGVANATAGGIGTSSRGARWAAVQQAVAVARVFAACVLNYY